MAITREQSELVLSVGNGNLGTMWHKSLPFAAVVDATMSTLEHELAKAHLPALGDDRLAVVEAAIAEHVHRCLAMYTGDGIAAYLV